jgi:CHAT domain-containing protein
LGDLLFSAFNHTDEINYLNESIVVHRDLLNHPSGQPVHFGLIKRLIMSVSARWRRLHHREDFDEILRLFSMAVNNTRERVPDRFQIACLWALLARGSGHHTVSAAYANAISLMQESLAFAPTLEIQHIRLVSMREYYETLPLDYASYLVHTGRLEQAIETLERGRALLWSEMRGLRTSIDQLCAADSALAEKFAAVNRELEMLTTSSSPSGIEITNGGVNGHGGMDPFGHLVVKQRKLLGERDRVISQVRTLSGFEGFLTAPSFDTLRSAASRGPVIIINHCKWRSNILILLHESPPSNITTTDDFYERALGLGDRLVKARKEHRLESKQYQRALRSVLKILYDLVGRPVIEEFRRLKIPEQSRVWWCPTSVFCTLPLHAMGPIPSDNEAKRYFLDLYISSYTPTLSALIESRKIDGQTLEKPSILLVAQPDESLLNAWEEIWVIQRLSAEVTTLISKNATPSRVVEGLQHHRFSHFACHGKLEVGKPFNASFKLYGGERLTLLNIVRSRLPTADFAFLSACHTAELTEESIADEALHLTAAMQYSGFRSVVGTMWAMADTDGRDLAEHFYKSLFSSEEPGVPYYELSARALRDAVLNLRRKKVLPLERWVNFVHYGA